MLLFKQCLFYGCKKKVKKCKINLVLCKITIIINSVNSRKDLQRSKNHGKNYKRRN